MEGTILDGLTWLAAEALLTPDTVVVIPLGAAAKEHGPHLPLNNDWNMAEYLKRRLAERARVVVAPTVPYHFYPAFVEYPGSVSLRLETARDLVVDIVRSFARHGPRRFYVLNTGVSTLRALAPAAAALAAEGTLLRFTDILALLGPLERAVAEQPCGTHADEVETSIMLHVAPETVEMTRAVRECAPERPGGLTRDPGGRGIYSPSGVWGDATLATREKGRRLVDGLVDGLCADVEDLRRAPLPAGVN